MLYKPTMLKLNIGSRRTGITRETKVPGAPHEPAKILQTHALDQTQRTETHLQATMAPEEAR